MGHATASGSLFAAHYVNLRDDLALQAVAAGLREHGLVTLDGLDSRASVLDLAARCLDVVAHRDSDPDGLTVIHNTTRHAGRPGFAGLGNTALAAHTDGTGTPRPPRLMLIACARPAMQGGTSLLTDGRTVYDDLAAAHPDAVEDLAEDRAGYFGGRDGVFAPVFGRIPGDRITLRLRLDDLVRWNPMSAPHVRALTETVTRHQQPVHLDAGCAYLLDNSRWLHARTAFSGPRRMYRALGSPRFELPDGFAIPQRNRQPLHVQSP